jgi:hypothetical protein
VKKLHAITCALLGALQSIKKVFSSSPETYGGDAYLEGWEVGAGYVECRRNPHPPESTAYQDWERGIVQGIIWKATVEFDRAGSN